MRHVSKKPLVLDISFGGEVKKNDKIIFSNNKGSIFEKKLLGVKKFFFRSKMREAAKNRIKDLCNSYNKEDRPKKIQDLLTKINDPNKKADGVIEEDVINAFKDIFREHIFWEKMGGDIRQTLLPQELKNAVCQTLQEEFDASSGNLTNEEFGWALIQLFDNEKFRDAEGISRFGSLRSDLKEICKNINNIKESESADSLLKFLKKAKTFSENRENPYAKKFKKNVEITISALETKIIELGKAEEAENARPHNIKKINSDAQAELANSLKKINDSENEIASEVVAPEKITHQPKPESALHVPREKKVALKSKPFDQVKNNSIILASRHNVFSGQAFDKKDRAALAAFRNFIRNPEKYSEPTKNTDNLYTFIDFFLAHFDLLDTPEQNHCLDGVDRLMGILQSREKNDIYSINKNNEKYKGHSELITSLCSHSDLATPSGFFMVLIDYINGEEIDDLSYRGLRHLASNQSLMESIAGQLSNSAKIEFSNAIEKLKTDLKIFKEIKDDALWKSINQRRHDTGLITELQFDELIDPNSASSLEKISKAKKIDSIKTTLNKINNFQINEESKRALQAFYNFLKNQEPDLTIQENLENLKNFSKLFFTNIQLLHLDARVSCMNEIDKLRGVILEYEKSGIKEIEPNKSANQDSLNLIKDWKFDAEYAATSSGFLIDMANYLNNGAPSINAESYWTLDHLVNHQAKSIHEQLLDKNARHFSRSIVTLRKDLEEFKKSNAE